MVCVVTMQNSSWPCLAWNRSRIVHVFREMNSEGGGEEGEEVEEEEEEQG
jgi:hypothetical protein